MTTSSSDAARSSTCVPHFWSAFAVFAALTIVLTYPLSFRPGSTVVADDPDTHLFIWTLAWDTHAFTNQPLGIFDANIFFPERGTLAYSENLIGSALFAAPVLWTTGNPVLAMNVVALLSCVLCGLGAYVLARTLGVGTAGALLCGVIFAFSPARFFRISQIHLTTIQWIPFALASLHAYFGGGSRGHLHLAAAFVTLQVITSGHGAVFIALAAGGYVLWQLLFGGYERLKALVRDLGFTGTILLVPSLLIFVPYALVQRDMGLKRSLVNWAPSPESFLASPTHLHAWILAHVAPDVIQSATGFLFPGYLPILLVIVALWWKRGPFVGLQSPREWWRHAVSSERARSTGFYALLTAVCLLLAAGPPIGIWPLVYWVPGFNFIRGPARFVVPAMIGIAVLAAFGFERMTSQMRPRRRTFAAILVGSLLLVEFAAVPIRHVPYRVTIPAADRWLNHEPKPFVVAEAPVFPSERSHTAYMLHSMAHWQKTVHGYSGMRPPLHEDLYSAMRGFPDDRSLASLAQLGVTYVIVHTDLYRPGEWPAVEARINAFASSLVLVNLTGDARVYRLNGPPGR